MTSEIHTLSDDKLLMLIAEGDHRAFEGIYDRYFDLVFLQAYNKLRDEQQAKDIVQEVFANLWLRRDACGSIKNVAGYLVTSVKNRIFNSFSRQEVQSKYIKSLGDFMTVNYLDSTDHLVREKEFAAFIEKSIQSLPVRMRAVFELSRKKNLSHIEIAHHLQTTEKNVAQHITNALKILRGKLTIIISMFI